MERKVKKFVAENPSEGYRMWSQFEMRRMKDDEAYCRKYFKQCDEFGCIIKPKAFHCRYCGSQFKSNWYRKIHQRKCAPWKLKLRNDRILIQIYHDAMNCGRAIATAKARIDKEPKWRMMQLQKEKALKLHQEAQVPCQRCDDFDVMKFQAYLKDYQIIVVDAKNGFRWKNFNPEGTYELILLREEEHYDVITSLTDLLDAVR